MRVVTFDGGGSLGLISLYIMREIEKIMGKPIQEAFDLFAGVSTGSIISAGLALGHTAEFMYGIYEEFVPKIFSSPASIAQFWGAKYDSSELETQLHTFLKGTFRDVCKPLMISAVQISEPTIKPKFWKSWDADDLDQNIADVAIASSSAPTYFVPKKIGNAVYVDGSVATNDVSMCVVADLYTQLHSFDDIALINIKTSSSQGLANAEDMSGLVSWGPNIINVLMTASKGVAAYQTQQLLGSDRYLSIAPDFKCPLDTVDINKLETEAKNVWEKSKGEILDIMERHFNI